MYDQSLENVSYVIKKDLDASNKKLRRLKKKAVLKSVVTTVILVGGVTTGILLPNPISMAVVLACATVLSGSEGIKHTLKRLKTTKLNKKQIQQTDKDTDEKILVSKLRKSVNEDPSAPPNTTYPNLRI